MSSNSTASSGGNSSDDNENGTSQKPTKYKSPKPTVTESTLLEKHSSAQPEEKMPALESPKTSSNNSDFIKSFFLKMKMKSSQSDSYNLKVEKLLTMLKKKKKNPDLSEGDSSEVDEYEYGYPSHV